MLGKGDYTIIGGHCQASGRPVARSCCLWCRPDMHPNHKLHPLHFVFLLYQMQSRVVLALQFNRSVCGSASNAPKRQSLIHTFQVIQVFGINVVAMIQHSVNLHTADGRKTFVFVLKLNKHVERNASSRSSIYK